MPQNDTVPSPPDVTGEAPSEQVCPPGWTLGSDGSCIPPTAIATPDPGASPGYYLREDGNQVPLSFDPPVETVEVAEGTLQEMAPDMPPAATPAPGATFDPKTGKLRAPGTMFDNMDIAPYGQGTCPDMYGGGGRAVFFAMGVSKMYALVVGADAGPQTNPGHAEAPKGSARIRVGRSGPKHGHVSARDRTTKIVTANRGYYFSLTPLSKPVEVFDDVYGRTIHVGKHVWTTPAPTPVTSAVQNAVAVGAAQPRVTRQGPVQPGGLGQAMGSGMPGLPPRNPEWRYQGPLAEVKM